ncbi:MAG: dTDP-4-amino-4,6-dideoxygalactose transaminase [Betaproteobacteria bacterium RIFCSPLOWO2_12_FULL_67_28]|nr:MAG: dTDP-4-amino-4,6-dideoxygalactose transaminase [Betaproteobacteria bacterium RIFCSPLOWO2_12_FULL_67_28]
MKVPFNRPHMTGRELSYIARAHQNSMLAGDGPFTAACSRWLEQRTGARKALLTHSCTAALDMAAILAGIGPGDEVILPSYTFVSTANAFVLRGGVPVFVDIRADTLNLDASLIESAITPRTRAIVPVHYAGVACEMDAILEIARRRGLLVIEDAAQGLMSDYRGRALGALGALGALSFHETKNVISGEGGALLVNDERLIARAEIVREKGTDRSRFFRGEVDKYTWVDIGSSFLPGEIVAAFLLAQMEDADSITARRLELWQRYHARFEPLERAGRLRRPLIAAGCRHNAHLYYILLPSLELRTRLMARLKALGILSVFHYVPLHSSPAGRRFGRVSGSMANTDDLSARVLRLPLWIGLDPAVIETIAAAIESL